MFNHQVKEEVVLILIMLWEQWHIENQWLQDPEVQKDHKKVGLEKEYIFKSLCRKESNYS